ncbi:MAG TPA: FAD-dependent oxidoreductase [Pseudonocardiaceae bacterium]|nr:FAD-dependent oxidoreductase [Pseudonocardiaceae bacterium]
MHRSALVVGAGVSGLTTALCLARRGFRVTIVADQLSPGITSNVAGALWEWPPAVCGRHHDEVLLAPSKAWSLTSYQRFRQLATVPDRTGVFLRPAYFYFREPVEDNPVELTKMKELADHVLGFVHRADLIEDNGVNPDSGMVDAYTFLAPMVDTDRYLSWLHRQAAVTGCSLLRRHISGDLRSQEQHLRRTFAADLIVNCTGLGAHELAGDKDLSPHRGAVIRVENTGEVMPRITAAHCVANNPSTDHQDMIFIVPRGENQLVLGGLVEPGEWDINVGLDYAPIRDLLRRNVDFLPMLAAAQLDHADPLRVGLRPFRGQSVRVEHEPGTGIIHNYGHGGAGVSLSWGCAEHVAKLASRLLDDPPLSTRTQSARLRQRRKPYSAADFHVLIRR